MIVDAKKGTQSAEIGRIGENNAREMRFYVGDVMEEHPDATFNLLNKRPKDTEAYPVASANIRIEDGYLYWTLQSADMAQKGNGKCQLIVLDGETIVKSMIYNTFIGDALDGSGTPPEPWVSWVEEVLQAAADAEAAAALLENCSAQADTLPAGEPATASYADGVFSFGIPLCDPADIIDDTAGAGEKNLTWSADKLATEFQAKADKADTVLDTTLSRGRKSGSSVGTGSFAFGNSVTANGQYSHAEGDRTTASGFCAHAEGSMTIASAGPSHAEGGDSQATGAYSHAEGKNTKASGWYSHAEGNSSRATGESAHAEGATALASAQYSHAEGNGTTASGLYAHAEGSGTAASGQAAHAEGVNTIAYGNMSHAEGAGSRATGINSHAEGLYATANHRSQHAGGEYNVEDPSTASANARGNYVEIIGNGTTSTARSNARTLDWDGNERLKGNVYVGCNGNSSGGTPLAKITEVIQPSQKGQANGVASLDENGKVPAGQLPSYVDDVINGYYYENQFYEDAQHTVTIPGETGKIYVDLPTNTTWRWSGEAFVQIKGDLALGETDSTAYRGDRGAAAYAAAVTNVESAPSSGSGNLITSGGVYTGLDGKADKTDTVLNTTLSRGRTEGSTVGTASFAFGNSVIASGNYTHAEGNGTNASGIAAHAEGINATASGYYSHAEGWGGSYTEDNVTRTSGAKGPSDHSEGYQTIAYSLSPGAGGKGAHSEGYRTRALHSAAHAEGTSTTANGNSSHAEGTSTTASGANSHAEGNSTVASGENAHAEGSWTTASGAYSHAEGNTTYAYGAYAHTEGTGTTAKHKSQHAGGEYNVVDPSTAGLSARGTYIEIIGNGTGSSAKSNARVLDWDGNERLAGDLYVGCNADSTGGTKVAKITDIPAVATTTETQAIIDEYGVSA